MGVPILVAKYLHRFLVVRFFFLSGMLSKANYLYATSPVKGEVCSGSRLDLIVSDPPDALCYAFTAVQRPGLGNYVPREGTLNPPIEERLWRAGFQHVAIRIKYVRPFLFHLVIELVQNTEAPFGLGLGPA